MRVTHTQKNAQKSRPSSDEDWAPCPSRKSSNCPVFLFLLWLLFRHPTQWSVCVMCLSLSLCVLNLFSFVCFTQTPPWIIRWCCEPACVYAVWKREPAISVYMYTVWQMWGAACLLSQRRWGISRPSSKPHATPHSAQIWPLFIWSDS